MKRIILLFLFLGVTSQAHALMIFDMDYTGNVAERIDTCGYGCGIGSTGGYLGGPVSNNSLGSAFQFEVDKTFQMSYLLASAHVRNYTQPDGETEGMEFLFKLYSSTLNTYQESPSGPYPDVNSLAWSVPMYVTTFTEDVYYPDIGQWHTFTRDGEYTDTPIPFKYKLRPGTYWIASERDYGQSGPIVDGISVEFAKGGLVNPEPSTIFLFGTGLAGALLRKRRKV